MTLLEKLLDENYDGIIVLKDKENNHKKIPPKVEFFSLRWYYNVVC